MGSLNKIFLMGNVGKIDIREVGESKVANVSLATTEKGFKTKAGKEIPDKTEWHNLVCWRGLATLIEKYVTVGSQLHVEGKLVYEKYEKDGIQCTSAKIEVDEIILCGGKKTGGETTEVKAEEIGDDDTMPF